MMQIVFQCDLETFYFFFFYFSIFYRFRSKLAEFVLAAFYGNQIRISDRRIGQTQKNQKSNDAERF